ncbi:alpha/beta hydrolase [Streptomyces sp. NPDC051572]|uniref:alpha/beta hydrolase n=1 Tax=Streptomyces sp. NPDC051572 TaxID=3155802 RepID=UPI003450CD00
MSYTLDPEIVDVMAALAEQAAAGPRPGRGDWRTLRAVGEAGQAYMAGLVPASSGVQSSTYYARGHDEAAIRLRWYTKSSREPSGSADAAPTPAVVYAHGGGMVMGTLDLYDEVISWYVDRTGVPFLSVDYRRAPDEGTGTTLAEDVFAALTWLIGHADELGVNPVRIAVMGDSGGGGPTAGAAILARDRSVPLARQILVYPMLDDRNQTPDPARSSYLTWTYDNNYTAWRAVLGDAFGADTVSPVAAPARLTDFTSLAPAYIDVGDLDIFRDEAIAYAQQLAAAGVPIELHVHPGVPHGWERFAPHAGSAKRAMADRAHTVSTL